MKKFALAIIASLFTMAAFAAGPPLGNFSKFKIEVVDTAGVVTQTYQIQAAPGHEARLEVSNQFFGPTCGGEPKSGAKNLLAQPVGSRSTRAQPEYKTGRLIAILPISDDGPDLKVSTYVRSAKLIQMKNVDSGDCSIPVPQITVFEDSQAVLLKQNAQPTVIGYIEDGQRVQISATW